MPGAGGECQGCAMEQLFPELGAAGLALGSRGTGCLFPMVLGSLPVLSWGGGTRRALSSEAADEPSARMKLEASLCGRNSDMAAPSSELCLG